MPPVFTSPDTFSITENDATIAQIRTQDDMQHAVNILVSGGVDGDLFQFNPETGELEFLALPDFETPRDAGGNNIYDVIVTASDPFGGSTSQAIQVIVTDLAEPGVVRHGGSGTDQFVGSFGNDTFSGGGGRDQLVGGGGNDLLQGDGGDDFLHGGAGADLLRGGAGRDTLDGGPGTNRLEGGAGVDKFIVSAGFQTTTIVDFVRGEHIRFQGGLFDNFSEMLAASDQQGSDVVITLDEGRLIIEDVQLVGFRASDFEFA